MVGKDAFKVEGKIVEVVSVRLFRVQLANGHNLLGFIPGKSRKVVPEFIPGDTVNLQLSSYDLSEGRIILEPERD